jgi:hypothetical protein
VLCPKCGAEAPEGTSLCSLCGEQLVQQATQQPAPLAAPVMAEPEIKEKPAKLGLPLLVLLGAAGLVIGPFLRWVFQSNSFQSMTMQGLYWSPASALYVLGVLVFIVTLVLKDRERQLSIALIVLGAACLALVGHFAYVVYDEPGLAFGDIREGFWVSAAGAFLTTLSGCPLFRKLMI